MAMRWIVALIWRLPPRSRRCRLVLPELTGIGATPAARASLASVAKRPAPAISPTSLGAVSGPKPGSLSSCGAIWATSCAICASSALIVCESSRMRRSSSRAMRTRIVYSAREAPGDPRRPAAVEQRAAGQLELGPEIVQMPLQRAVERDALTHEPFAVIDQQPQIELGPIQVRDREGLQALLQRGAGDGKRVDGVRLAALTSAASGLCGQVRRDPQHPLAAPDQKPLQRP